MAINLGKWDKEAAVGKLIADTFAKREEKARRKMTAACHRAIKKKLGSRYRSLTALPEGWAATACAMNFYVGGQSYYCYFDQIPVPSSAALINTFEARDPLGLAIVEAHNEIDKIAEEKKDLKLRATKIVERFRTVESLAKEWPLIAPYLPKQAALLPALPVAEITEKFKAAKAA